MEIKCMQSVIILLIVINITQISSVVPLFSSKLNANTIIQGRVQKRAVKQNTEKSYDIENGINQVATNDEDDENSLNTKLARNRRELSDWFIAPNTRWCGRGNTANGTYNQLGGASGADKCCRKHDHCQYFIPAFNTRYELFNYRPYTLSHCPCDRRFRTCLKMANDGDATTIGKIFFNMVQTQCFVLRMQKVCQERDDSGTCVRHYVRQKAELRDNKNF